MPRPPSSKFAKESVREDAEGGVVQKRVSSCNKGCQVAPKSVKLQRRLSSGNEGRRGKEEFGCGLSEASSSKRSSSAPESCCGSTVSRLGTSGLVCTRCSLWSLSPLLAHVVGVHFHGKSSLLGNAFEIVLLLTGLDISRTGVWSWPWFNIAEFNWR